MRKLLLAAAARPVGTRKLRWATPTFRRLVAAAAACAALIGAGGVAATPPTAVTGPVTAVGLTTATVTGTVNPQGQSTSWYVEYGTSTSYGSRTASVSAGSGTSGVAVSASLTGLRLATTYHYRVVASSGAGTGHGADGIFTTAAAPGAVTGAATSVTVSSATLTGSVDPNGRATTWYFEYGTSTSYGSKTAQRSAGSGTTGVDVSEAVSSLQHGRLYHYRLVAANDAGTTLGVDKTFSTAGPPTVSTGSASPAPTSVRLRGGVTPNGLATSWWFEYGTSTRYGSRTASHSAGSGTSAQTVSTTVSGLKRTTTYHYRLVASNSSGTKAGVDRAFTTSLPPGVQTGAAQSVGADSATVTGAVDPRGRATTWYFDYGTSTRYGSRTPTRSAGSGVGAVTVSMPLTRLAAATTYHVRLVAKSDAGTSGGADVAFTTAGVTLSASSLQVVFGRQVMVSGVVPTGRAGEQVTIFAQPYGAGSFRSVATVVSGAGGRYAYLARPSIGTAYEASWRGALSAATAVGVHPSITLRRTTGARVAVRVAAGRSFAGRIVKLQRRSATGWTTFRRVRLGVRSRAAVRLRLPRGRSVLRVAMSVNQAGAGYLGGVSRTLVVRR